MRKMAKGVQRRAKHFVVLAGLLLTIAAAPFAIAASDSQNSPPQYLQFLTQNATSNTEKSQFEIKSAGRSTFLSIPKSYIERISQPGVTEQSFIRLLLYLPDYLPQTEVEKLGQIMKGPTINGVQLRSPHEVHIKITGGSPKYITFEIESIKSRTIRGADIYGRNIGVFYNIDAHDPQHRVPEMGYGYLIPQGQSETFLQFDTVPGQHKLVSYTINLLVQDYLLVQALFFGEDVYTHSEKSNKIREIVSSFVISGSK